MRENAALSALGRLTRARSSAAARARGRRARARPTLAVKTPSLEAPVVGAVRRQPAEGRDGAGACSPSPAILVADEPTQGVDVGARAEIYRILREVSAGGVPVVVASTDAQGARGPVRPRHRDVARPRRRDARGRRGHRGDASSTRRSARRRTRAEQTRAARRAAASTRAPLRPGRLRAGAASSRS